MDDEPEPDPLEPDPELLPFEPLPEPLLEDVSDEDEDELVLSEEPDFSDDFSEEDDLLSEELDDEDEALPLSLPEPVRLSVR